MQKAAADLRDVCSKLEAVEIPPRRNSIGPYRLVEKLGEGGMAEVWRGVQRYRDGSERSVALKVLRPSLVHDEEYVAMFTDEANIGTKLDHENVGRIFGICERGEKVAQVLELIEGRDLRSILKAAAAAGVKLPTHFALMIVRDVARALSYVHELEDENNSPLEIVHRDVSPQNIMVDRTGTVKVVDFGIAKAKERISKTMNGILKGKLKYMAPEQVNGCDIGPWTDIFALGIVLWELLTGHHPIRGRGVAQILEGVLNLKVPSIRQFNSAVPWSAEKLVERMLQLVPEDRPISMRIVAETLTAILKRHYMSGESQQEAVAEWMRPFLFDEEYEATTSEILSEVGDTIETKTEAVIFENPWTPPQKPLMPLLEETVASCKRSAELEEAPNDEARRNSHRFFQEKKPVVSSYRSSAQRLDLITMVTFLSVMVAVVSALGYVVVQAA